MEASKKKIRNWKKHNQSLVNRGNIQIFLTQNVISSWLFEGKRVGCGKKPKYSDAAIKFLLIIFEIYSLRLRQLEGYIVLFPKGIKS
ncbi:transposase [Holospora obtusa]|uniref:transposase n=1 Tax=Holospora obtusa TaxID=49893 RepID=UPI0003AED7D4|nr:transposase [Holospora obtusa]